MPEDQGLNYELAFDFHYDHDCPACLRNILHTRDQHEEALQRVRDCSGAEYGPDPEYQAQYSHACGYFN